MEQLCRAAGDGPVICLLGAVGPDDVVELIRGRSGPTSDAAILLDIESWADAGLPRARRATTAVAHEVLARQRADAVQLLRAAGWRVVVARADQPVADVWAALAEPAMSPGPLGAPA